jgi:2-haloacid dehalogenase
MPIKHVFFDVNETLTDFSALASSFIEMGLSKTDMDLWFSRVLQDGFALAATQDSASFADIGRHVLSELLSKQSLDVSLEIQARAVTAMTKLPPHPDVAECFTALRDKGIGISTLSNGSPAAAEFVVEMLGCQDMVDHVLSVQQAPLWKPAREAYEYGLSAAGVAAEDAALVAVHPWDIHGAQRAGLTGVWVNRNQRTYPPYFLSPQHEVSSLGKVAQVLSK